MKNIFSKLFNYYVLHMKLKRKFMISHLLLALVPTFFITILCYSQLLDITTINTLKSLASISNQTQKSLGTTISQLEGVASSIESQDFFTSYIYNDSPEHYSQRYSFKTNLSNFYTTVNSLKNNNRVSAVKIYVDDEHYNALSKFHSEDIFDKTSSTYGTYWHGILSNTKQATLVCPEMYLSPNEIENYGDLAIVHNLQVNGSNVYIVVYFDQEIIDSILRQDLPYTHSVIYIINERDAFVSNTSAGLTATYLLKYSEIPSLINTTTKFVTVPFASSKVYCNYKTIPGTDWYMVTAIPRSNMLEEGNTLLLRFILIYLVILVIGMTIALQLNKSIVNRISVVIHKMQYAKYGVPTYLDTEGGTDEIGDLIETYNYMSDHLIALMKQQEQSAKDLRLSEFKALQSQINPHFLYNTLDMINWMAQAGKSSEISLAVQRLSRFYKLTLSKGTNIVSVKDELEHVNLYVQLQNMRFDNKIHFFVDVPDEMLEYEIPKLIFQPIVENSILHGILEKDTKEGNIVIMGWIDGEDLIFIVSDDGVGIPTDILKTILNGTNRTNKGNNIAVFNTQQRLQLYYGNEYGLTYKSVKDIETEVKIRIPARPFQKTTEQGAIIR